MGNNKTCGCCNVAKSNAQFYKSPIDGNSLPVCKNCCRRRMKEYQEKVGSASAAMWLILANLGVPFLADVYNRTEMNTMNAGPNTDYIMAYLKALAEDGRQVQGFWESDKMLDQLIDANVDRSENNALDIAEEIKVWGKFTDDSGNADIDAYTFLDRTFAEYTEAISEMDINLEKRYRDLVKAELRKRKADESGDIQEITKAQDLVNKQLALLSLNDFKKQDQDERKKFIDKIAWMIEETEPAEEEDESKYRDIAGYEKIYNSWMRSMQNILCRDKNYPGIPKSEI